MMAGCTGRAEGAGNSGRNQSAGVADSLLEAGYDISLDTGRPLESPVTLAPRGLSVELRRIEGAWKVEAFTLGAT